MPAVSPYLFQENFLEIIYDADVGCLHLNWKGYQTDASIKAGCERVLELMSERQVFKILNDNSNAIGIWSSMAKWLVFDLRPRAYKVGMKCCAHVFGPSRLSQISAEAALTLVEPFTDSIKSFYDIEEAKKWLRNYS